MADPRSRSPCWYRTTSPGAPPYPELLAGDLISNSARRGNRVRSDRSGTGIFVKAVGSELNPQTQELFRQEIGVLGGLPAILPMLSCAKKLVG